MIHTRTHRESSGETSRLSVLDPTPRNADAVGVNLDPGIGIGKESAQVVLTRVKTAAYTSHFAELGLQPVLLCA